jgi:hypothetical protein
MLTLNEYILIYYINDSKPTKLYALIVKKGNKKKKTDYNKLTFFTSNSTIG